MWPSKGTGAGWRAEDPASVATSFQSEGPLEHVPLSRGRPGVGSGPVGGQRQTEEPLVLPLTPAPSVACLLGGHRCRPEEEPMEEEPPL